MLPNLEDVGPLKALIAYDALVHPDHPLRKEGLDGIEMFMGKCSANSECADTDAGAHLALG